MDLDPVNEVWVSLSFEGNHDPLVGWSAILETPFSVPNKTGFEKFKFPMSASSMIKFETDQPKGASSSIHS